MLLASGHVVDRALTLHWMMVMVMTMMEGREGNGMGRINQWINASMHACMHAWVVHCRSSFIGMDGVSQSVSQSVCLSIDRPTYLLSACNG